MHLIFSESRGEAERAFDHRLNAKMKMIQALKKYMVLIQEQEEAIKRNMKLIEKFGSE